MAFVGELEIVDDLAHLPHLLDHRPRLGDRAPRISGPAGEEDRGSDFVEEVDRRELAVQVGVDLGLPHLLAVISPQVAALVRRRRDPIEVPDDAHAARPEVGRLLEGVHDGVSAIAHTDRPQTIWRRVSFLDEPSTARDDVLDVPAAQVAVAQTSPGAPIAGPATIVRREDREPLGSHELKPRIPVVHRLRLRATVRIHHRSVAAAVFSRHEEPRRDCTAIETRIPDEFPGGELVLREGRPEALDEGHGPFALTEQKPGRSRKLGMLVEQALAVREPDGPSRRARGGRDRSRAPAVSGDGLQLDVSITALQGRDALTIRGPEWLRLLPPAPYPEPDFL